ncbi:hypothetical protein [Thalassotalea agarivorans]|uniref:Sugar transporter n=1 Tax=Thalassotalea agarivorans TaxID=349064 RepID=A0A1I0EL59_THASX|nr:hypothetical protein [Thalassotalea agarivorans]SET46193.1 hypothetical protein SAMN05660429_01846 [Thalassotalea agarivorans]
METLPKWFKPVAITAIIWNVLGVLAFTMQMAMTPETLAAMPEQHQAYYQNMPMWVTLAFAAAVFGGAIGSVALFRQKQVAVTFFGISLLGVVVQMFHTFVLSGATEFLETSQFVLPVMILIVAIILFRLSRQAKERGWLTS